MRKFFLIIMTLALSATFVQAQSFTPDDADKKERSHFDFLIGEWEILEKKTMNGTESGGQDRYTFRKELDGNAIISEWYFNRGTKSKPNYTDGLYYTAYDNLTNTWSFYYISAASAQYYQGKKVDGQWYFFREFTIEGDTFLQRQSWQLENDSTLIRTIENSEDNGESWSKVYVVTLSSFQKAKTSLTQNDITAIRTAMNSYASGWNAENPKKTILDLFTEDAVLLPHHGDVEVVGKQNIQKHFWPAGLTGFKVNSYNFEIKEITGTDDLAYSSGRYSISFSFEDDGEMRTVSNTGNYVMIFRQLDDEWKISRYIWNDPVPETK